MAMKKIPTAEQNLLCASIYVNNFKRVVEELVYNALDASSSSIAIRVCIPESFIQVLDNGNGILHDNFSLIGQKYATSKYVDTTTLKSAPDKYGFRGLSLASIVDVSQSVQIYSRNENSHDTWLKTFCNGIEKEICKTIPRPSKGTTVEIKGFLYNLNIQRKSIEPYSEIHHIKTVLQQLSLVHYCVSISLRDDSKNNIIFQIHKNRNIYKTLWLLFGINGKDFQEFQVEKNEYKVNAYISKNNVDLKNYYHWIYLNGKFIHKSIIHKKINEHLSKYFCTRYTNKIKNMHVQEEINDYNWNIPFYFVFISCPNCDFNLNYNSEKSLVEFKDWNEINKLIEKLIQFYCSGASLVSTKDELNKRESKVNKSTTKAKVEGIIDKILNKKNIPRFSQLQNGVKGKIKKRNQKKKIDISMHKVLNNNPKTINPCQSKEFAKLSSVKKKIKQNTLLMDHSAKLQKLNNPQCIPKSTNEMINSQTSDNKTSKKSFNMIQKNFCYPDPIIKKFQQQTQNLKKQCKYVNHQLQKVLEKNTFGVVHNMNNKTKYPDIIENTETSYEKESEVAVEDLMHTLCNVSIKGSKNKKKYSNHQIIVKNSYDLLNTVINSQNNESNKNRDEQKFYYTCNETFIPMATYNSHNHEAVKQISYFISDNAHNNFILHEHEKFSLYKQTDNSSRHFSKNNMSNQLLEFSYNIEMENSQEIIKCESGHFFGSIKSQVNDINTTELNHVMPKVLTHAKPLRSNNTYTLEDFIRSSHNLMNKTYSLHMANMSHNYSEEIQPLIVKETIDNDINAGEMEERNVVIISDSENSDTEMMIINPINVCETVLYHSNELQGLEDEFEKSFGYKRDEVLLPNCNFIQNGHNTMKDIFNANNNCLATNKIQSNLDLNSSHFVASKSIQNIEIYNKIIQENLQQLQRNNIIKDDYGKTYNFQLKSRHRFMPKGLSPITKHSHPRNAYPSISDKIYYKDAIYTNFANDIIVNSEVFEPEVQNVKNLFLNDLTNVNSEVQKQNGDLIFDSQSLKQAKILGQVDRKFIATVLNGRSSLTGKYTKLLVLFDQHAVDERIRLEGHLSDYIQANSWKSVVLDPVRLELNRDDYLYFLNHKNKFTKFGLQWTSTTGNEILLNTIPKAILGNNPRQVEIVIKAVKKLILEQIKAIKSLRGNISLYPKSIMELVFSEACRYAIKFGDKLAKKDCAALINSLAYCKTPFQCAHGRPVMAVITELTNNTRNYAVELTKTYEISKWPNDYTKVSLFNFMNECLQVNLRKIKEFKKVLDNSI